MKAARTDTRSGRGHVLVVEDDRSRRAIVEQGLADRGFRVTSVRDGATGLPHAVDPDVDLVVVELSLLDRAEAGVLGEVRAMKPHVPAIVLGEPGDPGITVRCLDAGADDYMTRPVSIDELAARIRARLRRSEREPGVLEVGPTRLDLVGHRVTKDGRQVDLSAREVQLLAAFMRRPGRVLSRAQLLRWIWRLQHEPGSNVVTVSVASLRRKLGQGAIETVRGLGYRFAAAPGSGDQLAPRDTRPPSV